MGLSLAVQIGASLFSCSFRSSVQWYRRLELAVVSDRERWANAHGALCGGHLFWRFGLFREVNRGFLAGIAQKVRRFLETETAQRAARIDVPQSGDVLGLFTDFVRHSCIRS